MNNRRCYTPTEFALFGLGAVVLGIMVGVVGISWFKSHCLPDEKEELRERERELAKQQRIMRKFKIIFYLQCMYSVQDPYFQNENSA